MLMDMLLIILGASLVCFSHFHSILLESGRVRGAVLSYEKGEKDKENNFEEENVLIFFGIALILASNPRLAKKEC